MDRLEKALEKARRERAKNLREPVNINKRNQAPNRLSISPGVKINEAQLEQHRILAHHTRNAQADTFRILRTQVLQVMKKSGFKTLAITSPNYGDGKTTIALNLAVSIALDLKQTVLLADLDLRKPNLHEFLGLTPSAGLSNYLLEDTPLSECLMRLSFKRLSILPAGAPLDNSSEILASPKMAALAQELKSRYSDRMVIYDMPPILAQDDSIAFLPHVDAVLMVFRDGVTSKHEVKQCLDSLGSANVIGTVLNNSGSRRDVRRHKKLKNISSGTDGVVQDKKSPDQKKR